MKIADVLKDLRRRGIELRVDGCDTLVCNATKGAMTPEIGEMIRSRKAEIVAFLGQARRDKWSTLVPMQPKGSAAPFFCFHGVGGNVLNYSILGQYLGDDQPLYGLQSVGLDGTTPPLLAIPDMVEVYLREIRAIQPAGPYHLGGGSMGGLVAYEMARRLRREGQPVGLLVLFDTIGPYGPAGPGASQPGLKGLARKMSDLDARAKVTFLASKFRGKAEFRRKMKLCRSHFVRGLPIPLEHRFWFIEQMNFQAIRDHVIEPYEGAIDLIRGDLVDDGSVLADPLRGWTGMAPEIRVHAIGGRHHDLVEQPELGRILARCLREAQALSSE